MRVGVTQEGVDALRKLAKQLRASFDDAAAANRKLVDDVTAVQHIDVEFVREIGDCAVSCQTQLKQSLESVTVLCDRLDLLANKIEATLLALGEGGSSEGSAGSSDSGSTAGFGSKSRPFNSGDSDGQSKGRSR